VGVKFNKVSKISICQSCGNPWSAGNYSLKLNKIAKAPKIKKISRKKASKPFQKLSKFEQHLLDRHCENPSSLNVTCGSCSKRTVIPVSLPPKEEKHQPAVPVNPTSKKSKKKKNQQAAANIPLNKPVAVIQPSSSQKPNNKKGPAGKKSLATVMKQPGKKQQPKFSKNQLKNLSRDLDKNTNKSSSLKAFLNSVK